MTAGRSPDIRPGTVTRAVRQSGDDERVNVFIDGEFAFGVAVEVALDAGLAPGVALSAERLAEILRRDDFARARSAALRYLSQARTSAEVLRLLRRRGFDEDVAADVVRWAEERRYLDDSAYALAYVRARVEGRGHGPSRLRQDLSRRGVGRELIEAALQEALGDRDQAGAAADVARPRWRALGGEADGRRRRQKTLEFLVRRGFGYDDAREAVRRVAADEGDDFDDEGAE